MRKLFLVLLTAFVFLFAHFAYAASVKQRAVEVTAVGANRDAAIQSALVEAVSQVTGVKIDSNNSSSVETKYSSTESSEDDEESFINNLDEVQSKNIEAKAQGHVLSYELLSEKTSAANEKNVEVTIRALVSYYDAGAQVNRQRLAVLNFKIEDDSKVARSFARLLEQSVSSYLTQARNFAVLDREYLAERDSELAQLLRSDVMPVERARIGNSLGADYMLVGTINHFSIKREQEVIAVVNEEALVAKGNAAISWRLINVPTGMVVASKLENISFNEPIADSFESALVRPAEKVGTNIASRINEIIYPILVLANRNGTLTIGRGGDYISQGETYDLIEYGQGMYDPYTNEPIAYEEYVIGKVEITKVDPKLSYAKVISITKDLPAQIIPNTLIIRKSAHVNQKKHVKTLQPNW